jgi:hypothetical protein
LQITAPSHSGNITNTVRLEYYLLGKLPCGGSIKAD